MRSTRCAIVVIVAENCCGNAGRVFGSQVTTPNTPENITAHRKRFRLGKDIIRMRFATKRLRPLRGVGAAPQCPRDNRGPTRHVRKCQRKDACAGFKRQGIQSTTQMVRFVSRARVCVHVSCEPKREQKQRNCPWKECARGNVDALSLLSVAIVVDVVTVCCLHFVFVTSSPSVVVVVVIVRQQQSNTTTIGDDGDDDATTAATIDDDSDDGDDHRRRRRWTANERTKVSCCLTRRTLESRCYGTKITVVAKWEYICTRWHFVACRSHVACFLSAEACPSVCLPLWVCHARRQTDLHNIRHETRT